MRTNWLKLASLVICESLMRTNWPKLSSLVIWESLMRTKLAEISKSSHMEITDED